MTIPYRPTTICFGMIVGASGRRGRTESTMNRTVW
jgi:hypothetical protein